jgi:hypothetical protein
LTGGKTLPLSTANTANILTSQVFLDTPEAPQPIVFKAQKVKP